MSGSLVEHRFPEANLPWFCDDRGAIQSYSMVGSREGTRPVDIGWKCTKEYIDNRSVVVACIPPSSLLSDVFTKRTRKPLVQQFIDLVPS